MVGGKVRNTVKENFEMVYLRSNWFSKFAPYANLKHTDTKEYKKIISFISKAHFNQYKLLFEMNGFLDEDVLSIVKTFSLVFLGLPENRKKRKINYKMMMRFITQRMLDVNKAISRKFRSEEVVSCRSLSVGSLNCFSLTKNPEEILLESDDCKQYSLSQIELIDNCIKTASEEKKLLVSIDDIKKQDKKIRSLRFARKSIIIDFKLQKEFQDEFEENTFDVKNKKKEIAENKDKYVESLCYYATTKHVSYEVRKAAIKMCQKLGIDYKKWAQIKLSERPEYSSHFWY